MPSMQSTLILATALMGSLLQHAAAAPEVSTRAVQYPDCISTCMRNSGCFDSACICKKAADGILSDIVICMNQWCPADVTATDLIEPLESQCSLPKAAVQDAEKKGGVADSDDGGDDTSETSTAAKPTTTSASGTKGSASEVTMTFDVGSPQTAAADASTTTTVKASISGTLTIATEAATTGLLTDGQDEPTTTGSLAAATSTQATSSTSATSASASSTSSDDEDSAAGMRGQASVFGVVAAMGVALALGF